MRNSLLYAFFWVIPQRLSCICRRFGTLCLFHLHRHTTFRTRLKFEIETNSLLECLLFSEGILLRRSFSFAHEKKHWCQIQPMPKNESKRLTKCASNSSVTNWIQHKKNPEILRCLFSLYSRRVMNVRVNYKYIIIWNTHFVVYLMCGWPCIVIQCG